MEQSNYQIDDRIQQEFEDWQNDKCPDCQQAFMEYLEDEYDGHGYLLCPNINCRAKIWVSDIDLDD